MNKAQAVQMSTRNSNNRLCRIDEVSVSVRLTSIEDTVRPYLEFSEPLIFTEEARHAICERLEYVLDRSGEQDTTFTEIEEELKKFVQTLLLHCTILFGDEIESFEIEMLTFPEDEGLTATTN